MLPLLGPPPRVGDDLARSLEIRPTVRVWRYSDENLASRSFWWGGMSSETRKSMFDSTSGDISFVVLGWWIRLVWGVSAKHQPRRFVSRFDGHTFVGARLWRLGVDRRLVGVQTRRRKQIDRRFSASLDRPASGEDPGASAGGAAK